MSFQTYAFNYKQATTKDKAENNYPEVQSVIIDIIVNNIHIMKISFLSDVYHLSSSNSYICSKCITETLKIHPHTN